MVESNFLNIEELYKELNCERSIDSVGNYTTFHSSAVYHLSCTFVLYNHKIHRAYKHQFANLTALTALHYIIIVVKKSPS